MYNTQKGEIWNNYQSYVKEKPLSMKWLRQSGLIVNEEKTELCLFYKSDHPAITITINNKRVKSKKSINVLGVTFDCKLQWADHIAAAINKSKKSLHAIKLIAKYLNKNEIKQIITSNFYSQLYYNCEIWLMPSLSPVLKQQLLSASTRALKLLNNYSDLRISFDQQHKLQGRATPNEIMKYKLSIQLYKLYNGTQQNADWIDLNFQQNFNNRQKYVLINDESSLRIGKNLLMNRLGVLNNLIEYDWLNQGLNTFKLKSKKLFLTS